jgi:lipoprotein-anchoring transpeptidase ErfK/SrfK
MTDIYLRPLKPRKRGLLAAVLFLLLAAVLGAGFYWIKFHPFQPAGTPPVVEATPVPKSTTTPAAVVPAPQPAPAPAPAAPAQPEPPKAAPPAPAIATPAVSSSGSASLDEARQLKNEDQLLEARDKGYVALEQAQTPEARADAEALLGEVNVALVLSPRAMPEKIDYTVVSGDSMANLAKQYKTTVDVIRKGNNISGQVIRIGQRLRIFTGAFSIEVDKSDNTLVMKMNDRFFKRYKVGTGKYGVTPIGDFIIEDKIAQPTWWRPDGKEIPYGDPENLLGTHWLKLNVPGYGIHGTWEPDSVGKATSAGCIRLVNSEVEELFTLVPLGTPVKISE